MSIHYEPDAIDRLFALLDPIPLPSDLLDRALAEAVARQARRRRRIVAFAVPGYAAIVLALAILSFALGRAIAGYGAGAILAVVTADPRAVVAAPADVLLAVTENLPWGLVAAVLVTSVVLARCTLLLTAVLAAPPSGALKTGARHA